MDGTGVARSRTWRGLPTAWAASYTATAAVGAVRAPGTVLVAVALLCVLLLVLPALAPAALTAPRRSRRVLLLAAAAVAAVVPFAAGAESLGAPGTVVAAVLTASGGALALRAAEDVGGAVGPAAPRRDRRPGSPRQEA
ncbi:hypothetical protein [Kineococcus sp. G2]|uniref:hypothetical protein n=1 Tax=Kineococcus sp. G2 TaxID=3127484 RepID=UPI00301DD338